MERESRPEMASDYVTDLIDAFEDLDAQFWLDGGWGVDALLGAQTREHQDLDIVVQRKDVERLRTVLEERGYSDAPWYDAHPWVFLMEDQKGHQVDFHVIDFDPDGNGLYGPPEDGVMYPAESLSGRGSIDGRPVRCISAEWQVKFHSGYQLTDKDHQDIRKLCERFDIPIPDPGSIPQEGTRWQALKNGS